MRLLGKVFSFFGFASGRPFFCGAENSQCFLLNARLFALIFPQPEMFTTTSALFFAPDRPFQRECKPIRNNCPYAKISIFHIAPALSVFQRSLQAACLFHTFSPRAPVPNSPKLFACYRVFLPVKNIQPVDLCHFCSPRTRTGPIYTACQSTRRSANQCAPIRNGFFFLLVRVRSRGHFRSQKFAHFRSQKFAHSFLRSARFFTFDLSATRNLHHNTNARVFFPPARPLIFRSIL